MSAGSNLKIKAGDEILLTGVLAHVVSIGHDDIADRPLLNLYGNEPEFSYFTGWATSVEVYSKRTGRFRRVDGDVSYRYIGYEKCCQCQAAKTLDIAIASTFQCNATMNSNVILINQCFATARSPGTMGDGFSNEQHNTWGQSNDCERGRPRQHGHWGHCRGTQQG